MSWTVRAQQLATQCYVALDNNEAGSAKSAGSCASRCTALACCVDHCASAQAFPPVLIPHVGDVQVRHTAALQPSRSIASGNRRPTSMRTTAGRASCTLVRRRTRQSTAPPGFSHRAPALTLRSIKLAYLAISRRQATGILPAAVLAGSGRSRRYFHGSAELSWPV